MNHGGRRAGAGRKRKDSVTLSFSIPREAYDELKARERATGIYRTRIAAELFMQALAATMANPGSLEGLSIRKSPSRAVGFELDLDLDEIVGAVRK